MTDSDLRERRIEAAARALNGRSGYNPFDGAAVAEIALDAADEAVPMVPASEVALTDLDPERRLTERDHASCPVCGSAPAARRCGCLDVAVAFGDLMVGELRANAAKGGRVNWQRADPRALLDDVHDHTAKLHVATRELLRRRAGSEPRAVPWGDRSPESLVREFAADTANMALMLLDSLGLLDEEPPTSD